MWGPLGKEPWHLLQSQISGSPAVSRVAVSRKPPLAGGPSLLAAPLTLGL